MEIRKISRRLLLWALIVSMLIFFAGCKASESVSGTGETSAEPETEETVDWDRELFNRFYDTNSEQADEVFQTIISAIESQDTDTMKALFSDYALGAADDLDGQITALLEFYEGEMTAFERFGPGTRTSKNDGEYYKVIRASYDVTTTAGYYRMAIKFCTVDTANPENVGLCSVYFIKAEDSDLNFAYWGGVCDEAIPGITIVGGDAESDVES